MKFTVEQDDDIVIFTLKEPKLDSLNAPDVKAELLIIGQPNVIGLIIDLSKVTFCDSAGLSAHLLAHRQLLAHLMDLFVCGRFHPPRGKWAGMICLYRRPLIVDLLV